MAGEEINPYAPTVPEDIRDLDSSLFDFLEDQTRSLREQHLKMVHGQTTMPSEALDRVYDSAEFELGIKGRFNHPVHGLIRARFVKFVNMITGNGPVGVPSDASQVDWVVTNDFFLSDPFNALGIIASSAVIADGQFGWVIVEGANLEPLALRAGETAKQGNEIAWSGIGEVTTELDGVTLGFYVGSTDVLPAAGFVVGDILIQISSNTNRDGLAQQGLKITGIESTAADAAATVSTLSSTVAANDLAIAKRVDTVEAGVAGNSATLTADRTARVTGDAILAKSVDTLRVQVGDEVAALNTVIRTAEADADTARAASIEGLRAQLQAGIDGIQVNTAAADSIITTLVTRQSASATAMRRVEAGFASSTANLAGATAGPRQSLFALPVFLEDITLVALDLIVGDFLSWGGFVHSDLGNSLGMRVRMEFVDSGSMVLSIVDTTLISNVTEPTLAFVENVEIPAGTVSLRLFGTFQTSGGDQMFIERVMLNRGGTLSPFVSTAALASAQNLLEARVGVNEGGISANSTAITNVDAALTVAEGDIVANASAATTLEARVTVNEDDVVTAFAKWSVGLNVDGHISGIELNSGLDTSQFIVNVDEFRIADATTQEVPFEIVGGVVKLKSLVVSQQIRSDNWEAVNKTGFELDRDTGTFRGNGVQIFDLNGNLVFGVGGTAEAMLPLGTQNLLGPNAKPVQTFSDSVTFFHENGTLIGAFPVEVGNVISLSGFVRWVSGGTGNAKGRIGITFQTAAGGFISNKFTAMFPGDDTNFQRLEVADFEVPATTGKIQIFSAISSGGAGANFEVKDMMLNRGPVALAFEEPPMRAEREGVESGATAGAGPQEILNSRTYGVFDRAGTTFVDTPDKGAFDSFATATMTWELELFLDVVDGVRQVIWSKRDSVGWEFQLLTSGKLDFILDLGATTEDLISDTVLPTGKWIHIAVTRTSAGLFEMILDDVLQTDNFTNNTTINSAAAVRFGARFDATSGTAGRMQDGRIWGSTRTRDELRDNRLTVFEGNETQLQGLWRFDEGSGLVVRFRGLVVPNSDFDGIAEGGFTYGGLVGQGVGQANTTTQNLLPSTAAKEFGPQPAAGGEVFYYQKEPIKPLGLAPLSRISMSAEMMTTSGNATNVRIQVNFFDAMSVGVGSSFLTDLPASDTSFTFHKGENFEIPAGTVLFDVKLTWSTNPNDDIFVRNVMLNRGSVVLPFAPSFEGAEFGVSITGQITAANVSTFIANAAILNAQIGTLDAGKITTGLLVADRIQLDDLTLTSDGSGNLIVKADGITKDQLGTGINFKQTDVDSVNKVVSSSPTIAAESAPTTAWISDGHEVQLDGTYRLRSTGGVGTSINIVAIVQRSVDGAAFTTVGLAWVDAADDTFDTEIIEAGDTGDVTLLTDNPPDGSIRYRIRVTRSAGTSLAGEIDDVTINQRVVLFK